MKTIHIDASKHYDVLIGGGLLDRCGEKIAAVCGCETAAVISDDTVFALYGGRVCKSLADAGIRVVHHTFAHGESSKNLLEYAKILNFLADSRLTRADAVVALGGGVTGDLAGFAAATYLRGVRLVQLPTTLLAAVDSSVGGKTAVDLPAGKNLAGCFYQPDLVLCDTDTLSTLPDEIFRDGCAEVVKYAVLGCPELYEILKSQTLAGEALENAIALCVACKRDVVNADEFDRGRRQLLNLGHTFGHAVEAASHFTVSHGRAVAIGMAIVSRASNCGDTPRILALLEKFGLPTRTDYSADDLFTYTLSDKKRSGGTVNLIIPHAIGDCAIVPTKVESLKSFIQAGL